MDKTMLKNHHLLVSELKDLEEMIKKAKLVIDGVGAQVITDEPKGGARTSLSDKVARMVDMKDNRDELAKRVEREKLEIQKMIRTLENSRERRVMRLRYLDLEGATWLEIANHTGYVESYLKEVHGRALRKLFPNNILKSTE